jgi:tetratricopeptide (TPR) repeat protein
VLIFEEVGYLWLKMKNYLSIDAVLVAFALVGDVPSALALSPVQVEQIARQTTIQITKCDWTKPTLRERGAGVIIQKNGNTYQVLTVAQAVRTSGCELVTPDGSSYRVDRVQALPNRSDLAVISFTSNKNYPVAKLIDNSNRFVTDEPIYVSNFAAARASDPAVFTLIKGTAIGNSTNQLDRGYSFIYSHNTRSATSGNPVWNDRGETIAIQGQGDISTQLPAPNPNARVQTGYNLGIGINTFTRFAAATGIRGYAPIAVAKPTPVDDLIASAIQKERKGDYRGMLVDLEQGIFLDSQNPRLYYSRGVAKSMLGNKDAIEDYNFAISLNLRDAPIYNNRGVAKAEFGDNKGAVADYRQAIAIDPNYADPYYNRGQIEVGSGDKKGALSDFDRAIALNPNFDRAYLSRGMIKSTLGDKKGEIEDFNRAIALAPNYTEAYYQRGLSRLEAGDKNGAIADFNRTIALNPKQPEAYNERGDAKAQLGDNNGAIADYDRVISLNPSNARAYFNRALIEVKLGNKKGAILDLKKAANRYKQQKQLASYQKAIAQIKQLGTPSKDRSGK